MLLQLLDLFGGGKTETAAPSVESAADGKFAQLVERLAVEDRREASQASSPARSKASAVASRPVESDPQEPLDGREAIDHEISPETEEEEVVTKTEEDPQVTVPENGDLLLAAFVCAEQTIRQSMNWEAEIAAASDGEESSDISDESFGEVPAEVQGEAKNVPELPESGNRAGSPTIVGKDVSMEALLSDAAVDEADARPVVIPKGADEALPNTREMESALDDTAAGREGAPVAREQSDSGTDVFVRGAVQDVSTGRETTPRMRLADAGGAEEGNPVTDDSEAARIAEQGSGAASRIPDLNISDKPAIPVSPVGEEPRDTRNVASLQDVRQGVRQELREESIQESLQESRTAFRQEQPVQQPISHGQAPAMAMNKAAQTVNPVEGTGMPAQGQSEPAMAGMVAKMSTPADASASAATVAADGLVPAEASNAGRTSAAVQTAPQENLSAGNPSISREEIGAGRGGDVGSEGAESEAGQNGAGYQSPAAGNMPGELKAATTYRDATESALAGIQAPPNAAGVAGTAPQAPLPPALHTMLNRAEKLQELMEHFDRHLAVLTSTKDSSLSVDLFPPNLGRLTLNCREDGGNLFLEVVADNRFARSFVASHEDHIRDVIQNGGFKLAQFDVRAEGDGSERRRSEWAEARERAAMRPVRRAAPAVAVPGTMGTAGSWSDTRKDGLWLVA